MIKHRWNKLRPVAMAVIVAFTAEQTAFAAPALPTIMPASLKPAVNFRLPESVAVVEDSYKAPGDAKMIFLIQDAHTNDSGQMNVAKALDEILPKEDIGTVFTEADNGDVSVGYMKPFFDKKIRQEVARKLVRKGEMRGHDYANLVGDRDFTLWGVEDPALYLETLKTYQGLVERRDRVRVYLDRIQRSIETLKNDFFSAEMNRLDTLRLEHNRGDHSLADYADDLLNAAAASKFDASRYANIKNLRKLREMEKKIDFKAASSEERSALKSLPQADREELLAAHKKRGPQAAAADDGFYTLFADKLRGRESQHPELAKYFEYLKETRRLNALGVVSEVHDFEEQLFLSIARTQDEAVLWVFGRNLEMLQDLIALKVSPDDFNRIRSDKNLFDIRLIAGYLNRKISDLDLHYENAVTLEASYDAAREDAFRFYELTLSRDRVFLDQVVAKMEKDGLSKSVLITGGYHTPNLKAMLRAAGYSYVVLLPQVLAETDTARYERLLLSQIKDLDSGDAGNTRLASGTRPASKEAAMKMAASPLEVVESLVQAAGLASAPQALRQLVAARMAGQGDENTLSYGSDQDRTATPITSSVPKPVSNAARMAAEGSGSFSIQRKSTETVDGWELRPGAALFGNEVAIPKVHASVRIGEFDFFFDRLSSQGINPLDTIGVTPVRTSATGTGRDIAEWRVDHPVYGEQNFGGASPVLVHYSPASEDQGTFTATAWQAADPSVKYTFMVQVTKKKEDGSDGAGDEWHHLDVYVDLRLQPGAAASGARLTATKPIAVSPLESDTTYSTSGLAGIRRGISEWVLGQLTRFKAKALAAYGKTRLGDLTKEEQAALNKWPQQPIGAYSGERPLDEYIASRGWTREELTREGAASVHEWSRVISLGGLGSRALWTATRGKGVETLGRFATLDLLDEDAYPLKSFGGANDDENREIRSTFMAYQREILDYSATLGSSARAGIVSLNLANWILLRQRLELERAHLQLFPDATSEELDKFIWNSGNLVLVVNDLNRTEMIESLLQNNLWGFNPERIVWLSADADEPFIEDGDALVELTADEAAKRDIGRKQVNAGHAMMDRLFRRAGAGFHFVLNNGTYQKVELTDRSAMDYVVENLKTRHFYYTSVEDARYLDEGSLPLTQMGMFNRLDAEAGNEFFVMLEAIENQGQKAGGLPVFPGGNIASIEGPMIAPHGDIVKSPFINRMFIFGNADKYRRFASDDDQAALNFDEAVRSNPDGTTTPVKITWTEYFFTSLMSVGSKVFVYNQSDPHSPSGSGSLVHSAWKVAVQYWFQYMPKNGRAVPGDQGSMGQRMLSLAKAYDPARRTDHEAERVRALYERYGVLEGRILQLKKWAEDHRTVAIKTSQFVYQVHLERVDVPAGIDGSWTFVDTDGSGVTVSALDIAAVDASPLSVPTRETHTVSIDSGATHQVYSFVYGIEDPVSVSHALIHQRNIYGAGVVGSDGGIYTGYLGVHVGVPNGDGTFEWYSADPNTIDVERVMPKGAVLVVSVADTQDRANQFDPQTPAAVRSLIVDVQSAPTDEEAGARFAEPVSAGARLAVAQDGAGLKVAQYINGVKAKPLSILKGDAHKSVKDKIEYLAFKMLTANGSIRFPLIVTVDGEEVLFDVRAKKLEEGITISDADSRVDFSFGNNIRNIADHLAVEDKEALDLEAQVYGDQSQSMGWLHDPALLAAVGDMPFGLDVLASEVVDGLKPQQDKDAALENLIMKIKYARRSGFDIKLFLRASDAEMGHVRSIIKKLGAGEAVEVIGIDAPIDDLQNRFVIEAGKDAEKRRDESDARFRTQASSKAVLTDWFALVGAAAYTIALTGAHELSSLRRTVQDPSERFEPNVEFADKLSRMFATSKIVVNTASYIQKFSTGAFAAQETIRYHRMNLNGWLTMIKTMTAMVASAA